MVVCASGCPPHSSEKSTELSLEACAICVVSNFGMYHELCVHWPGRGPASILRCISDLNLCLWQSVPLEVLCPTVRTKTPMSGQSLPLPSSAVDVNGYPGLDTFMICARDVLANQVWAGRCLTLVRPERETAPVDAGVVNIC